MPATIIFEMQVAANTFEETRPWTFLPNNASGDISFHILHDIALPWLRITPWFLTLDSAIVQCEYSMDNSILCG